MYGSPSPSLVEPDNKHDFCAPSRIARTSTIPFLALTMMPRNCHLVSLFGGGRSCVAIDAELRASSPAPGDWSINRGRVSSSEKQCPCEVNETSMHSTLDVDGTIIIWHFKHPAMRRPSKSRSFLPFQSFIQGIRPGTQLCSLRPMRELQSILYNHQHQTDVM